MFGGSFEHLRFHGDTIGFAAPILREEKAGNALPDRRGIFKQGAYERRYDMDDKTTETTNSESRKNTFLKLKPWYTIEAAASLMALGDIVVFEYWCNNAEIQAAYKMLYDEVYKAYRYSQYKFTINEMVEWIKNDPCMEEERKTYTEFIQFNFITTANYVFVKDAYIPKTFPEIHEEICALYSRRVFANGTTWEEREEIENVQGALTAKMKTIADEANMFGLDPRFYPEEKTPSDCFYFYPVSFKGYTTKVYIEVRTEGIKAWLKYNNITDKFFNPAPQKPITEITDVPKLDVSSGDDIKEQPTDEPPKGWPNPFKGLDINRDDWYNMWQTHLYYLTEHQSIIYIIKTTCEPKPTDTEIGQRLGITRQAVDNAYKKAVYKVKKTRPK